MNSGITPISGIRGIENASEGIAQPSRSGAGSFAAELRDAAGRVERAISDSRSVTEGMLRGESVDLHQVAMRAQEAQLSFEMFLQVRNKFIQGYQEIMRMQV